MIGRAFNSLLSGRRLGTSLRWQRAHRCPCAQEEGEVDTSCGVCRGTGRYYDAWSDPFTAGFIGQDSQSLRAILQKMGDGAVGDAVMVLPMNAPCYDDIASMDRIQVVNDTDTVEWVLTSGPGVRLPSAAVIVSARVRSVDGGSVVDAPIPAPGPDGRIVVTVPTTITFRVSRLYEVVKDLSKVRQFGDGLPRRIALKRVDFTVR